MNNQKFRRLLAFICILLVLVYASALLLPHSHEDGDEHCVICALIKVTGGIPAATGLYFLFSFREASPYRCFDPFHDALILHDSAPVWLKVKLSD